MVIPFHGSHPYNIALTFHLMSCNYLLSSVMILGSGWVLVCNEDTSLQAYVGV